MIVTICLRKNCVLRLGVGDSNFVAGNPTVGFTRSEGGTDKTAELTEGMDGTRKFAW